MLSDKNFLFFKTKPEMGKWPKYPNIFQICLHKQKINSLIVFFLTNYN